MPGHRPPPRQGRKAHRTGAIRLLAASPPRSFAESREIANAILTSAELRRAELRRIEDGPFGGIPLYVGATLAGEILDAPLVDHDRGWGAGRLADASLAQTAHALAAGKLWLPAMAPIPNVPITRLGEIGQLGVHDSLLRWRPTAARS